MSLKPLRLRAPSLGPRGAQGFSNHSSFNRPGCNAEERKRQEIINETQRNPLGASRPVAALRRRALLRNTSTARAGASNTPWGTIIATLPATAGSPFAINPKTNAVYAANYSTNRSSSSMERPIRSPPRSPSPAGWMRRGLMGAKTGFYVLDTTSRPPRRRYRCEDKLDHQHDLPRPTAR